MQPKFLARYADETDFISVTALDNAFSQQQKKQLMSRPTSEVWESRLVIINVGYLSK